MDAIDLARWTRFAAKGGIGKCTAVQDCVAEGGEDLMFLKDDEIVVLLQLPQDDQYLGYCEGVVGRFHGSAVRFHGKLKKPVFAKRQSTAGTSPSRTLSYSTRSPPPTSSSPSGSRPVISPIPSPFNHTVPVPSPSENRPSVKHTSSTRSSKSTSTPQPVQSRTSLDHSRTPSNASSVSHYSNHSRSYSQSQDSALMPAPAHLQTHARKTSTASSRSAYSSGSRPSSRSQSRSDLVGSGSEDTHTQHVSVPPPLPTAQTAQNTPALTDGSSAHSSLLFSPAPGFSPFPQTLQGAGKGPASLFQGRSRSGSEKILPRTENSERRRRSGSENVLPPVYAAHDDCLDRGRKWDEGKTQAASVQGDPRPGILATGVSETSFRSVSVYSDASGKAEEADAEPRGIGGVKERDSMISVANTGRGILNEDESDEDYRDRRILASSPENLSDGGFGIGMTLLREEADSDEDRPQDPADDETAVGHVDPHELEKIQTNRRLRTTGMRVVNRSSISPSVDETDSEAEEDDTVMPIATLAHTSSATTSDFRTSSSSDTIQPVSRHFPSAAATPPRPPFATRGSSSSRTSSVARTDDENWESDADIYDDYRYSRYSTHYSGSPAQHSSRRASKGSTKSGRSRASERPPLPDEESWRKTLATTEGGEESTAPQRKSLGSERSSVAKLSNGACTDRRSVSSSSTTLNHASTSSAAPFSRGAEVASTTGERPDAATRIRSRTPSLVRSSIEATPSTPAAMSIGMMSLTSPLTRAFRRSDDSKYSRESEENDDADTKVQIGRKETPVLSARHLPSPGPEDQRSRSRSPVLASSLREKITGERRAMSPNLDTIEGTVPRRPLSVKTSRVGEEPNVVILSDSPVSNETPDSRSVSRSDDVHLRVGSPQSNHGSTPPSPLNPGFPPSPSSMASFAPTAPLTITKSPTASPSTPRQPIVPPAIPFTGVPPPGRPPAHMEYAYLPHQSSLPSQYQVSQHVGQGVPPSESLHSALRMAGQQRASTIHGRTQMDLLSATGPVPISFLLPGMVPSSPPPGPHHGPFPRPQPAAVQVPYGQVQQPAQIPTHYPAPGSQSISPPPQHMDLGSSPDLSASMARPMHRPLTAPVPNLGSAGASIPSAAVPASPVPSRAYSVSVVQQGGDRAPATPPPTINSTAAPLPRANFFPKVGQARPRSRSFSGFKSEITERISQSLSKRSQEEGSQPFNSGSRPNSPSSRIPVQLQPANPSNGPMRGRPGPASRPSHGPSPLSLPPTNNIDPPPTSPVNAHASMPSSPIVRTTPFPTKSTNSSDPQPRRSTLRQVSSHLSLRPGPQAPTSPTSFTFPPQRRNSGQSAKVDEQVHLEPPSPHKSSIARYSHDSDRTHSSFNRSDMTSPQLPNSSPSSSPLIRSGSLRSKISISALRSKGTRSIRDGAPETAIIGTGSSTTLADEETVQIKDLEFELVRPQISDLHRGEEGTDSRDAVSLRATDLRQDSSSVRSGALSPGGLSPSSEQRFQGGMNISAELSSRRAKGLDMNTSVQAHRDRELKWISTMNSNDAAQAKKSKKIKKLLIDGVPSSVRYLVWAHISNSGSKKMSNVYTQLSKRRPAMARDIERDVEQSFPDHPHLRDPQGPLVSVLFAYIAMVPDLRYHRGLAIIAGHLLLQSPEEDAFWTFLAIMDSYLRPYFMPTSPQMGVDTNLFIKAVEAADPQLANRVFAELKVRPQELCGVWFSSVFAGTLPLEHLHRVWDLFLYEGIPFLFRVGLAILFISRRYLFESPINPTVNYTSYLLRPPPEALPTDPEQFISQALTVKLKDDDVRKSRVKMEAAVKQQRVPRMSTSQPSHPHVQGGHIRVS